jgi:hypothetical protein
VQTSRPLDTPQDDATALPGASLTLPARVLLATFGVLTALAVVALLGGATRTDEAFAWTIQPPLAAAFLGAGYAAGCVLVLLTLRAGTWVQARWPLLTILVFTVLTLVATLLHLDRFHLPGDTALATGAAWFWLLVYVVVPVGMAAVLVHGERTSTTHAAGAGPRPPRWFRLSLVAQALVLGVLGVCLFLGIDRVVTTWPWTLTPLVAQVTAAWLVSFAVAALMAVREDPRLLGPAGAGYLVFGAAEVLAAVLHRDDLDGGPATAAYLLMAAWVALTGAAAVTLSRRHAR